MVGNRYNREKALEAWRKREKFIQVARETGKLPRVICEEWDPPIAFGTYQRWREKERSEFAARFDAARRSYKHAFGQYDGSFVSFRQAYLGMHTTWFQALIAEAIEKARPGEVTLVLIPPEHGKTTLLEDWCTYKLVRDPSFRITVASEKVDHGIKVVSRVRERLEPDGPTPIITRDFGTFAPESARSDQEWGMKRFNTAQKRETDERDYSMTCIGMTGGVQGTRCDLLVLDDIQDLKSTELSQKYFSIITQSFLSRPSMFGRTVIIGTRVDEYDVYRRLMDAEIPDNVIRIPAYDLDSSPHWAAPDRKPVLDDPTTWAPEGVQFMWPEMYDQEERGGPPTEGLHRFRYAALRHRVGEQTWWRIYMQKPEAATAMTFDEATTEAAKDEHRSVIAHPKPLDIHDTAQIAAGETRMAPVIVTVDPSVGGGNGVLAAASRPKELQVLHCRLDYGLTKYSQIIEILEEECHRYTTDSSFVSIVVVEANAFQKGLLQDDRLLEVQSRFGFRLIPDTTTRTKSDPDIGVPAMPSAMLRHEITLPWADGESQSNMALLLDQLHMWRPGLKGNKPGGRSKYVAGKDTTPQDLVMCLWFAYKQWRATRDTPSYPSPDVGSWRSTASPLRSRRVSRHTGGRRPYRGARR